MAFTKAFYEQAFERNLKAQTTSSEHVTPAMQMTRTQRATAQFTAHSKKEVVSTLESSFWKNPNVIDVARNVYTRDHARCETRRGRDVYVFTKRVFLNAKSSIELRKKCRGALTSSKAFLKSAMRLLSTHRRFRAAKRWLNVCALLEKISLRWKEIERKRERSTSLFLPPRPLSFSRKLGFPRRARDRRREEEHHHHPKAIGSLFFLFFSLWLLERFWLNFSLSQ